MTIIKLSKIQKDEADGDAEVIKSFTLLQENLNRIDPSYVIKPWKDDRGMPIDHKVKFYICKHITDYIDRLFIKPGANPWCQFEIMHNRSANLFKDEGFKQELYNKGMPCTLNSI